MSVTAVAAMSILGAICGSGLYIISRRYSVKMDERIDSVLEVLPGANCGACGFGSCLALAEAVVSAVDNVQRIPRCIQGGDEVSSEIEAILSVQAEKPEKLTSTLICDGGSKCGDRFEYEGVDDCREVIFLNEEGNKTCRYACVGHGTCERTCPFDAITMGDDGLPKVDRYLCRGCGLCVKECPRNVLRLSNAEEYYYVACSSHDDAKKVKSVCEIGCIACRTCEKNCPVDAVHVTDNLSLIDPEKCNGCGICAEKCPRKVIKAL
jgi:electron transport complex protein RnfB